MSFWPPRNGGLPMIASKPPSLEDLGERQRPVQRVAVVAAIAARRSRASGAPVAAPRVSRRRVRPAGRSRPRPAATRFSMPRVRAPAASVRGRWPAAAPTTRSASRCRPPAVAFGFGQPVPACVQLGPGSRPACRPARRRSPPGRPPGSRTPSGRVALPLPWIARPALGSRCRYSSCSSDGDAQQRVAGHQPVVEEGERPLRVHRHQPERQLRHLHGHRVDVHAVEAVLDDLPPGLDDHRVDLRRRVRAGSRPSSGRSVRQGDCRPRGPRPSTSALAQVTGRGDQERRRAHGDVGDLELQDLRRCDLGIHCGLVGGLQRARRGRPAAPARARRPPRRACAACSGCRCCAAAPTRRDVQRAGQDHHRQAAQVVAEQAGERQQPLGQRLVAVGDGEQPAQPSAPLAAGRAGRAASPARPASRCRSPCTARPARRPAVGQAPVSGRRRAIRPARRAGPPPPGPALPTSPSTTSSAPEPSKDSRPS